MSRKLILGLLSMAFCLGLAGAAAAQELVNYDYFTVTVPQGWAGLDMGETVVFTSPDDSAAVTVTVADVNNMRPEDLAGLVVTRLKGTGLVFVSDNRYSFKDDQGREAFVTVNLVNDRARMLTVRGADPAMEQLINSISYK